MRAQQEREQRERERRERGDYLAGIAFFLNMLEALIPWLRRVLGIHPGVPFGPFPHGGGGGGGGGSGPGGPGNDPGGDGGDGPGGSSRGPGPGGPGSPFPFPLPGSLPLAPHWPRGKKRRPPLSPGDSSPEGMV